MFHAASSTHHRFRFAWTWPTSGAVAIPPLINFIHHASLLVLCHLLVRILIGIVIVFNWNGPILVSLCLSFLVSELRNPLLHNIIPDQSLFLFLLLNPLLLCIFLPFSHRFRLGHGLFTGQREGGRRELGGDGVLHLDGLQVPDGVEEQLRVVPGEAQQEGRVPEVRGLHLVVIDSEHVAEVQLQGQRLLHRGGSHQTLRPGSILQRLGCDGRHYSAFSCRSESSNIS